MPSFNNLVNNMASAGHRWEEIDKFLLFLMLSLGDRPWFSVRTRHDLPGYNQAAVLHNYSIEKKRTQAADCVDWIIDNKIQGWAITAGKDSYHISFMEQTDYMMARMAL